MGRPVVYLMIMCHLFKVHLQMNSYLLNDHVLSDFSKTSLCEDGTTRIITIDLDEITNFVTNYENILKDIENKQLKEKLEDFLSTQKNTRKLQLTL